MISENLRERMIFWPCERNSGPEMFSTFLNYFHNIQFRRSINLRLVHELWDVHHSCPRPLACTSLLTSMEYFAIGCTLVRRDIVILETVIFFLDSALQIRKQMGCGHDESTKLHHVRMWLGCGGRRRPDLRMDRMLATGTPQEPSYRRLVPGCKKLGCDSDGRNLHATSCIPVSHPSPQND